MAALSLALSIIWCGIVTSPTNWPRRPLSALSETSGHFDGVNGHVSISLTKLEEGLNINGINGGVELGFSGTVNAALDVHGINGGVSSDFPLTVVGEMKRGEMRGTIGSGGPSITVKGINGGVQIKRR